MSIHRATTEWQRSGMPFELGTYSRAHRIEFDPTVRLDGNAAKENIPPGAPHAKGADPEQLFVASLSACHMLWFVSLASTMKLVVNRYVDNAEGVLEKNSEGRMAMTRVTLRPAVEFAAPPSPAVLAKLHHKAHEKCFIANSVRTQVIVEPR
ncbi:MAG: OsmC family peroxiredoxin [Betaproteobacteria bacterium]|nr:MAG: OsmC family peroxiredoxin [Betaproteobacteria bacterium]